MLLRYSLIPGTELCCADSRRKFHAHTNETKGDIQSKAKAGERQLRERALVRRGGAAVQCRPFEEFPSVANPSVGVAARLFRFARHDDVARPRDSAQDLSCLFLICSF